MWMEMGTEKKTEGTRAEDISSFVYYQDGLQQQQQKHRARHKVGAHM